MEDECIHGMTPAGSCAVCSGADKTTRPSGIVRRSGDSEGRTQQEWCDAIADIFGVPRRKMAAGSTEPTTYWDSILQVLNLEVTGSKPMKARVIVESQGLTWPTSGDSTDTPSGGGSTIRTEAWIAVYGAAKAWRSSTCP